MGEWKECKLGDVLTVKHGWPFQSEYFCEAGRGNPIVVGIGNFIYTGGFRFETTKVKEYIGSYPKDYELEPGDILLVMTCQTEGGEILGIPGRIPNDGRIYLHNQRLGKIIINRPDIIDKSFLYWLFLGVEFNQHLVNSASGTKILHTSPNRIQDYNFFLPPLPEQRAIAGVLGSLDDKIDLLHCQNKTLEALAETLFRQWFVEEADEGWEAQPLGNLVEVKRGGSPRPIQDYLSDTGLRWLKISDATKENSPYVFEIKEHIKESGLNKTTLLKKGTLVLSNSATPGIPKILQIDSCIHDGWLHFPKSYFSKEFLYLLFKSIREELISYGNGSIFINLKTEILKDYKIPIPGKTQLQFFQEPVELMFEKILKNAQQIRTIEKLRDTLLPKLMSGEVRVDIDE